MVAVAVLAEEAATGEVAGVGVVAAALGTAGAGDFHVPGGQLNIAGGFQLGALQLQLLLAGQLQCLSGLEAAGDAALFAAGFIPVGFPQVFAMVALVAGFMGFGGGVNVQVGTAVDAQSVARFHMAGFDLGVGTGRQRRILLRHNLVAVLARVFVGGGAVVGFVGEQEVAVVPLFTLFLELAAFQAAEGQVAAGVEFDVAPADVGGGQVQVLGAVQVDIALAAVHASASGVEAVGAHLAADIKVAGRTDLHPVSALHLHAAHAYTGAFGGADDVDAPGLHGAEQARVDALVLGLAGRVHLAYLPAGEIDLVAADGEVQLIAGTEATFAVDARRDQVDGPFAVVQALALHCQLAVGIAGAQGLQLAVVEFRAAHHQVGIGRVDETAAIHRNAVRVGQHVIGRLAENLLGAVEGRGVAADHFVEDHARRLALELRVGRQLPGKLGLASLQGVVQHQALAVDVVIQELVMGQATGVRRDDVDDGYAALVLQLRRAARAFDDGQACGERELRQQEQAGDGPAQFALG